MSSQQVPSRVLALTLAALMLATLGGGAGALVSQTDLVLPEPRYTFGAVWDDREGVGYLLGGGVNNDEILRMDPTAGTVTEVDLLPSIREGACAVWDAATRSAYLFFGWTGADGPVMSKEIVRFRPDDGSVEVVATHTQGNSHCSAVWDPVARAAYVFGGDRVGMTDEIGRYTPDDNTYIVLDARLPSPRSHTSASWDPAKREAYIIGGWQGGHTRLDEVVAFSPDTGNVRLIAHLPTALSDPASFWGGRHLYVIGGHPDCCTVTGAILRVDPITFQVTTLDESLAAPRAGASAFWDGRGAYIAGGNDAQQYTSIVERFVPAWPRLQTEVGGIPGRDDWFLAPVEVVVTEAPGSFGLDVAQYRDGSTGAWGMVGGPFTVNGEGRHELQTRAIDIEGGIWDGPSKAFGIDTVPPASIIKRSGHAGVAGWWRSPVEIQFSGTDATSGYATTWFALDGSSMVEGRLLTVDVEGKHKLRFQAEDIASNRETMRGMVVKLDFTPPVVKLDSPRSGSVYVDGHELRGDQLAEALRTVENMAFGDQPDAWVAGWVEVDATAMDPGQVASGVFAYEISVDGEVMFTAAAPEPWTWDTAGLDPGLHTLQVVVRDRAGNTGSDSLTVRVLGTPDLPVGVTTAATDVGVEPEPA